jgi:hypothetical protein
MKHKGLATLSLLAMLAATACTASPTALPEHGVSHARKDGGVNGLGGGSLTSGGTASGQSEIASSDTTRRTGVNGLGGG